MNAKQRYDKKVKQTRIFLSDYLLLKEFSRRAGVSMAEALHKLIIGLKPEPKPGAITTTPAPSAQVTGIPVPVLRVVPVTTMVTNGSKVAAFRIKTGVTRYE